MFRIKNINLILFKYWGIFTLYYTYRIFFSSSPKTPQK